MMTEEQKSKVQQLKARIAATAGGAPPEVRVEVLALKKDLRRDGTTARALASALGVHETTLCRWERERPARRQKAALESGARGTRTSGFRVVQLAAPEATPVKSASPSSRSLRVAHAPSGLVIDGLDVETLATLLRRMS